MPEHNPAAALVRECGGCKEWGLKRGDALNQPDHVVALRKAYLAERARVAEVVAAVDAALNGGLPDVRNHSPEVCHEVIRDALAPFRSES